MTDTPRPTWRFLVYRCPQHRNFWSIVLEMLLALRAEVNVTLVGQAEQLAVAFDVSPEFFMNIHKAWRDGVLQASGEAQNAQD